METTQGSKLLDLIGKLKVLTVVVGIFSLGFFAASFDSNSSMDEYSMAMVCIAFILSLIFVIAIIFGVIPITEVWRRLDMVYHGLLGILLALGTLFMLIRFISSMKEESTGDKIERSIALILTFINTGAYSYIAIAVYRTPSV